MAPGGRGWPSGRWSRPTNGRDRAAMAPTEDLLSAVVIDGDARFAGGVEVIVDAASHCGVKVVGRTTDAGRALELVRFHHPDLTIVDVATGAPGPIDAIAEVKRHLPHVRVLAISGNGELDRAVVALEAGADGFMLGSARPEELVPPLMSLALGIAVMPERLKVQLLRTGSRPRDLLNGITEEERRLWRLLAQGLDTVELGRRLSTSERTVRRLVASLLRKVGAANRHEAAALAGQAGLLDD